MNGTMIQHFHWYTNGDGTLWNEISERAEWLASIGITSMWMPPATKGDSGGYSVGYDIYDLYDLGEFDQKGSVRTRYGTLEEYLNAVKTLKKNGIQVIADIVLNHKAGGDEPERVMAVKVADDNRKRAISQPHEIEAFTRFTFPGRNNKYSDFVWNFQCFTGVDYDNLTGDRSVFRLIGEYGHEWDEMIDSEKGNYDYLMYNDIEFRNPAVREELFNWIKWYYEKVGFDGVRLDAVKHIPAHFYNEWLARIREITGKEIFAVGEYWAPGLIHLLLKYIEATEGRMSLFDSSLQQNLHLASTQGQDYDMRKIFDETLVQAMPDKAVTVVDNHDTQPLQALEAPVEFWFKPLAYALILLRQDGYPCVFYPDLYGTSYKDHGKDGNEYEIFLNKVEELEQLLLTRKDHVFGMQRDYFDHGNCIGWTLEGDDEHTGCAVIMSNGDAGHKSMEMGKRYAGKSFFDALGKHEEKVTINEEGWGEFLTQAGQVSVWLQED